MITVKDSMGNVNTDTIAITVYNREEIDTLLKGKWDGMKEKLINGSVEGALGYYSEDSKERYRTAFTKLSDKISLIVSNMQDIELIYVKEGIAKYRVRREQAINGELKTVTYYIYFSKGQDGLWRIEQF